MRKTLLIVASAAIMLATPAMAGGYVGAVYVSAGDTTTTETWQGEGAVGFSGGHWGAQIDAAGGGGDELDFWSLGGHVYWSGAGWRLGGVVATMQLQTPVPTIDETVYGIEGSYDFGPNTVAIVSATLGDVEADVAVPPLDSWNIDAGLNHYFSPNARVGGKIGVGHLKESTGIDEADTFSIGINAECQPWATTPLSITVAYNNFEVDPVESDAWSIGLRWSFGGGSLRERDNSTPFDVRTGYFQRILDLR